MGSILTVAELRKEARKLGYKIIKVNPPRVAKYNRCRDCKWLNTDSHRSIGYECTHPTKEFRTSTAHFKYKHNKACKLYEKK